MKININIRSTVIILASGIFFLGTLEGWMYTPKMTDEAVIEQAAAKGLQLLQKSSYAFINNNRAKCASCHHNTLNAMATDIAARKGVPIIDSLSASSKTAMENTMIRLCNPNLIPEFLPVNFAIPYMLLGINAEKYSANIYTDVAVDYIMGQAKPDGSFLAESGRVPLETGDVHLTAMAIRAIELYAAPAKKPNVDALITKTRHWLETTQTSQQQELVFQLLGMQWCGSKANYKLKIASKLRTMQNNDGGWSQLPTLGSDAYATGQALYALYESGMNKPEDEVYQRGLHFLLKTQDDKGAWFVATRSFPIQPFVSSDFPPYDDNQFISAAGSNWAVMALLNALPDKK